MITKEFPHQQDHGKDHVSTEEIQERIKPDWHEINITEGSEFLDDAIRTKDQPLGATAVNENE